MNYLITPELGSWEKSNANLFRAFFTQNSFKDNFALSLKLAHLRFNVVFDSVLAEAL